MTQRPEIFGVIGLLLRSGFHDLKNCAQCYISGMRMLVLFYFFCDQFDILAIRIKAEQQLKNEDSALATQSFISA